jgi:hypothetical protein
LLYGEQYRTFYDTVIVTEGGGWCI